MIPRDPTTRLNKQKQRKEAEIAITNCVSKTIPFITNSYSAKQKFQTKGNSAQETPEESVTRVNFNPHHDHSIYYLISVHSSRALYLTLDCKIHNFFSILIDPIMTESIRSDVPGNLCQGCFKRKDMKIIFLNDGINQIY